MTPTEVVNIALSEIGQQVQINSFSDATPAARAARTLYTPKIQMLLRSANWDFARAGAVPLTQWKAAVINGQVSSNPPPQPWLFSYLYPSDCLRVRFTQPTLQMAPAGTPLTTAPNVGLAVPPVPTAVPFVPGTDFDDRGNPVRTILSNLPAAQAVYTRDLSQIPDAWDPLFLAGATSLLGGYLINALARNKAQLDDQVAMTKGVLDQARVTNGNENLGTVDHVPDWIRARRLSSPLWSWASGGPNGVPAWQGGGYEACGLANGDFY